MPSAQTEYNETPQGTVGCGKGLSPSQCSPVSLPKPSRYASQPRKKFTEPSSRRWNTCGDRTGRLASTCPLDQAHPEDALTPLLTSPPWPPSPLHGPQPRLQSSLVAGAGLGDCQSFPPCSTLGTFMDWRTLASRAPRLPATVAGPFLALGLSFPGVEKGRRVRVLTQFLPSTMKQNRAFPVGGVLLCVCAGTQAHVRVSVLLGLCTQLHLQPCFSETGAC